MRTQSIVLAVAAALFSAASSPGLERLWMKAEVNGKRARLSFDSGADDFVLFRAGARRLGIKFSEPPTNAVLTRGQVPTGITEACSLLLERGKGSVRFRVVDLPDDIDPAIDGDGVVGWWVIRKNIIRIDASANRLEFLPSVPKKAAEWLQFQVGTNSGTLCLQVSPDDGGTSILVDTGSEYGVSLPAQAWKAWKVANPREAVTLLAFSTPADGLVAKEESWAKRIALGSLVLSGVPVTEATATGLAVSPSFSISHSIEAACGLAALARLELIIDGKSGVAYVKPKTTHPTRYQHNRLGAAFVPSTPAAIGLVARVAPGSPAEEAGIRDGDILLKVNGEQVFLWTDALEPFWKAAGTKVRMSLARDGKTFETTAVLRDILCAAGSK